MGTLVSFQNAALRKASIALAALIWPLTCVDALVSGQAAFLHKAFITLTADIRLPTRVSQQMRFKVASLPKYS